MSGPAFPADIAPSATLGAGCTVDGGVRVGERVQLAAGVLVSGPAVLEEAVQVGAGAGMALAIRGDLDPQSPPTWGQLGHVPLGDPNRACRCG